MDLEEWPLEHRGRGVFVVRLLGLEDDLNHSYLFMEAVDRMPTWVEEDGRRKKFSTYYPPSIEEVMKDIAYERDMDVELPCDSWDSYRFNITMALSGFNELTDDERLRRISKGHDYNKYYGPDFGKDDFDCIKKSLGEYWPEKY